MKFNKCKMEIGVLTVLILIVGSSSLYFYANRGTTTQSARELTKSGETYLFIKPAFAQSMSTTSTFLDEEAGISLYVNIGRPIDLAVAKAANWSGLEKETADYVVGSIHLPGLTADENVHCFVHKDGWIVTYYLKGEPISKIVDWNLWSQSTSKLLKNKLQVGLEQMTYALGTVAAGAKYYHFGYPNATKCMIIFRTLVGGGEDSFNVTIPDDIAVYERSWSHYVETMYGVQYHSYFKIDGGTINSMVGVGKNTTEYGILTFMDLVQGATSHVVSVSDDNYSYISHLYGVCIGLVYQEP